MARYFILSILLFLQMTGGVRGCGMWDAGCGMGDEGYGMRDEGLGDSVPEFYRFLYVYHGLTYWNVRFGCFNPDPEKFVFYSLAANNGLFIENKDNLANDSALFYSELSVKEATDVLNNH